MDNLKQELELDVHKVPFDELYKRFSSNPDTGKKNIQTFLSFVYVYINKFRFFSI